MVHIAFDVPRNALLFIRTISYLFNEFSLFYIYTYTHTHAEIFTISSDMHHFF